MYKSRSTAVETRAIAAQLVAENLFLERFPARLLAESGLGEDAFVRELVLGVTRRRRTLFWACDRVTSHRPRGLLLALLFVGAYQVLFMDRVPDYAAVDATVGAARRLAKGGVKFLNAVLRRIARERGRILTELEKCPPAIRFSHPEELVGRWRDTFGEKGLLELLAWNNRPALVIVRLRGSQSARGEVIAEFSRRGIAVSPHDFAPEEFFVIGRGEAVPSLPGFNDGLLTVQDPSTALAVRLLDPQSGENILDACAAPGGKSVLIADRMGGRGRVVALEKHADRLMLLKDTITRSRHGIITPLRADATEWVPESGGFDAVLADVPCSNTGVIRRRPDVRWRFSRGRLKRLCSLQQQLLRHLAGLVRPGGRLVYSTCSLEPEENEEIVRAFLAVNRAFFLEKEVRLFPPEHETDGSYAALLIRKR